MTSRSVDLSPRKAALVAGFGYLGILVVDTIALSRRNLTWESGSQGKVCASRRRQSRR
jgi:hypothetical protein